MEKGGKTMGWFLSSIIILTSSLVLLNGCTVNNKKIKKSLKKEYGLEFEILSSDDLYDLDDIFSAKAFTVSPAGEPDFIFYAYSYVVGEKGGVPGFKSNFRDTFLADKFRKLFIEYMDQEGLDYHTSFYSILNGKTYEKSDSYYTNIYFVIDVSSETLDIVSNKLSFVLSKILEDPLFQNGMNTETSIRFCYRDSDWAPEKMYYWRMDLFIDGLDDNLNWNPLDISAEGIRSEIMTGVENYLIRHP